MYSEYSELKDEFLISTNKFIIDVETTTTTFRSFKENASIGRFYWFAIGFVEQKTNFAFVIMKNYAEFI